jgi:hypothetical protein
MSCRATGPPFWRFLRGRSPAPRCRVANTPRCLPQGHLAAHPRAPDRRGWPCGRAHGRRFAAVMGQHYCPNSPCQNSATETRVRHPLNRILRVFCCRGPYSPSKKRTTDRDLAQSHCAAASGHRFHSANAQLTGPAGLWNAATRSLVSSLIAGCVRRAGRMPRA